MTSAYSAASPYFASGDGPYESQRSVLFPGATVFVNGAGKFWRQDASGNTVGPF